ncbi:MAG TPA: glycosyltransferase family 2 protein [Terracidiphilus sp.]|jgi:glycosyltransferase involved in cell wall biosynthesis
MSGELVSVVVPTYNRGYCIGRTIDSVRAQSHADWELIVVDDGSTDNTAELIKSNYGHDPRVRYLVQENAGVSAARNTGIRASKGDYVAFLDSDDVWKPWKLKVQLGCFQVFPEAGMVWTDFAAVDQSNRIVEERYLRKMYDAYRFYPDPSDLFSGSRDLASIEVAEEEGGRDARAFIGNIYAAMLRGNLVHTSTVMLSRERLLKVKEFDESLVLSGEDYDFHFRTCKWGAVCFIDLASTLYQVETGDRLSLHKAQIAANFVKTVEGAISREEGSGQFSAPVIREVLAEAHGWLAEELFKSKDLAGAASHALRSLRHKPRQPRLAFLLGLSLVPPWVSQRLLNTFRYLKRQIGRPLES